MNRTGLIDLSLFVLNRKTNNIRQEIYDYLVKGALFDSENTQKNLNQIIEYISSKCGFTSDISRQIRLSLERLSKNKQIIVRKGLYRLSEDANQDYEAMISAFDRIEENVLHRLYDHVAKQGIQLSESVRSEISNCLISTISNIMLELGRSCAEMHNIQLAESTDSQPHIDIKKICEKALSHIENKKLKEATQKGITSLFEKPDEDLGKLLHSIAQSYILTKILNVDPSCRALQKKRLRLRKLYLDTNILISLLCNGDSAHIPIRNIMGIIVDLGIKTIITKQTKQEFLNRMNLSENIIEHAEEVSEEVIEGVMDLMEDPFIKTFWMKKKNQPNLKWEDFALPLLNLEYVLKDKFNITFDKSNYEAILTSSNIPTLVQIVQNVTTEKTNSVAQHDAFHIELVKYFRAKQSADEFGPKLWFLTRDFSLPYVERLCDRYLIPSSIHVGVYAEMLSPFLAPNTAAKTASEVFMTLLGSRMAPIASRIKPIDLIDMTRDWTDDPKLTVRTIRKLVGERYVQEYLEKIRLLPISSKDRSLAFEELKKDINTELKRQRIKDIRTQKILSWVVSLFSFVIADLTSFILKLFDPSLFYVIIPIEAAFLIGFPKIYDWLETRSIEINSTAQ